MAPKLVGYGIPDYSKFVAGAPVLIRIDEWEHVDRLDGIVVHAGRLRDAFSPEQALLMRDGPFAASFPPARAGTLTHLLPGRRSMNEAPDGLQVVTLLPGGKTRAFVVMIDDIGVVDGLEAKPPGWPEHLAVARRIEARVEQALRDHHETLTSLLYR